MTASVSQQPISTLAPLIEAREISSQSLLESCLETIDARSCLNAFTDVFVESARADAREADRQIAGGRYRGPLHGVTVSVKDLIDIRGTCTSAASRVRASHVAGADAPVVGALREAGAVLIGKCNLHEFAFGTTSEESAFGPVRNPWDESRSPGGSSGGSAAAVAAGMSLVSIGTDTGGSIRIPAAACGVVGLKPTYGELPCEGVVPLARSLDHVGLLTRSVADARLVFGALKKEWRPPAERPIVDLRFAVLGGYFVEVLDDEVREQFEEALDRLRRAGARLETVDIPHASDTAPIYLHTVLPEAAAYHRATLESVPEAYTPGVRLRLEMGRYVLAEDYVRAQRGREILRREVDAALEGRDAIMLPSLAIPAPPLGASSMRVSGRQEPVRSVMLRLTQLFNLTGHPALSLPCGQTRSALPCGLQLVGRLRATGDLLDAAAACEPYVTRVGGIGRPGGGSG